MLSYRKEIKAMMKLSEIRTAYEDLSSKLSEINRQLCFAGFAIIWIFNKSMGDFSVPQELYFPAFLLCASLFADLLQYITSSLSWYVYYLLERRKYKSKNDDDIQVCEPEWLNILPWILFCIKVLLLFIGYFYIGKFLINKI